MVNYDFVLIITERDQEPAYHYFSDYQQALDLRSRSILLDDYVGIELRVYKDGVLYTSLWDYHEVFNFSKEYQREEQEALRKVISKPNRVEQRIMNELKESSEKVDFHGEFNKMAPDTQDLIINPKHYEIIPASAYKDYPDGLEYMDIMKYALSHLKGVVAHTLGHIFKYSFRLGKKDDMLQDAKKIQWYANRLVFLLERADEIKNTKS